MENLMLQRSKIIILLFIFLIIGIYIYIVQYSGVDATSPTEKQLTYDTKISKKFPTAKWLENGDIVFRRGYGVDSNIAVNFSDGEKRYSHAGIIIKENDVLYVLHSVEDKKQDYHGVVKEKLKLFLNNMGMWAVYRYDLDKKTREGITQYALMIKKSNVSFDKKFDLNSDGSMYCSEYIYKVVNKVSYRKIITAKKIFAGRLFVTVSNLYENRYSILIDSSHKKLY